MRKRTGIALVALALGITALFSGCNMDAITGEMESYDPATEMVADIMGKTIPDTTRQACNDYEYMLFEDGTAVITAYQGTDTVLNIPGEVDGHTVVALENKALYKNETVQEIVFPDSLEVIGNFAVMYCKNLEKVTFGKNIKNIGVSAFESLIDNSHSTANGALTTIVWNGAPEIIREKAFYSSDKLTEICLPDGVKRIENWAFAKCFHADKIILGEGLEYIGDHAFLKCREAKEIYIPSTCKTVDTSAFYQCRLVEKLTLCEGIETLRKGAFEECEVLKNVTIPASVKTMEPYVFYNCKALEECHLSSVETMEKDIFTGDKAVKIFAPEDSTAKTYADKNKIRFTAE